MSLIPDINWSKAKAAIAEYDGGLSRSEAETVAARSQGFPDVTADWQWLADEVVNRKLP